MALETGITLLVALAVLLVVGMPIGMSAAALSIEALLLVTPFEAAALTPTQKAVSSSSSFSPVAIPFFIFSGVIMNNGGTAQKLVDFSMLPAGRVPGALMHTNVLGNTLFGSISSSVIVTSAAIGGVLIPQRVNKGCDRKFAMAVNIASTPTGVAIPLSTAFITYSLAAGGASISSLFLGGYLVGSLWVLGIIVVAHAIAKRHNHPTAARAKKGKVSKVLREAVPNVLLIVIIIGDISTGLLTAVETSAIVVAYSLLTSMFYYKTVKINDLPKMLKKAVLMNGAIMFLLAIPSMTSFAMAFTGIPEAISTATLGITDNKYSILLLINVVLLSMGMLMDVDPAILIFTPIFSPIVMNAGVDPVHSGLFAIMNLCVSSVTPPVGIGLYVGASVGGVKAGQMLKPPVPFYLVILVILLLITYVPELVMWLPNLIP